MNIKLTFATTLLSVALMSGIAVANNATNDLEGDMMYGHGFVPHMDERSPAKSGSAPRQELMDDMLYSGRKIESHGRPAAPPVAGADNHDDSDSMMHNRMPG